MKLRTWIVALTGVALAPNAMAAELGSDSDFASVRVHAFASQGFILSRNNNYLAKSKHGSFEFSEIGINFTKNVTERLRFGVQFFARDLGPTGNYNAKVDWFYLDYRFADWFGLRAGRVKIPFGLYNEINDVDAARTAILLPQSVYPIQNRDFLLAQSGVELYGRLRSEAAGALDYRLYGGTIFIDATTPAGSQTTILDLTVPYVAGGRVMWETPLEGLRLGGTVQAIRLDTTFLFNAKPVDVNIRALLWVASLEYAAHDLLLATEYSRWHTKSETSDPAAFPQAGKVVSERAYAMASYRVAKWFQPGIYHSLEFPNVEHRSGRENMRHDTAFTLRYDINPNWLFKLEAHYVVGTAGLSARLNDGTPPAALAREWGVFLAKTTAYF